MHQFQTQVFADVNHGVAGDPVECARRQVRGVNHAVLDDKQVLTGAFRHKTTWIQQHGFVVAVVGGFHIGQDGVGVVGDRLGLRHGDVDVVAGIAGNFDADAALQALLAKVRAPRPGGDHQMNRVAFGRDAELAVANPGQRAQIAALQLVFAHHIFLRLHHLFFGKGDVHAQNLGAVEEALGVFLQAEDGGAAGRVVGAYTLKSAAAVVQGVGQHMDLGVAPLDHAAVHPDFAVAVGHGGRHSGHGSVFL